MIVTRITGLFPLWALLGSALAYAYSVPFIELKTAIVPLLGLARCSVSGTIFRGHCWPPGGHEEMPEDDVFRVARY